MSYMANPTRNNKPMLACLNCNDGPEQAFSQHGATLFGSRNTARPELRQTEDFLAAEMNKLSVQERLKALDDMHCVGEGLKETPEMIQRGLSEFRKAVAEVKNPVYEMACQQDQSYMEDSALRLQFLRANLYDVGASVRKMMKLLEYKAKYFGCDKVARDITLDDLNEEDIELMLSGLYHIQDGRDRSGRVIVYLFNHMYGRCRADSLIRVAYYVWIHIITPIPEVQTKGAVAVYFDLSNPGKQFTPPGLNFTIETMNVAGVLPVRNSALHLCLKPSKGTAVMNDTILGFAMKQYSRHDRARASLHFGSDMELLFHLQSRGIPIDTIPVDDDGNFKEDILNTWFYKHRDRMNESRGSVAEFDKLTWMEGEDSLMQSSELDEMLATGDQEGQFADETKKAMNIDVFDEEEQPVAGSVTVQPTSQDVMLGKGKSYQNHPGNIHFRTFLENYYDEYDTAPRNMRSQVCAKLNHILRAKGVRFIEEKEFGVWVESDTKAAEKKIGQLFRSLRKKKQRNGLIGAEEPHV